MPRIYSSITSLFHLFLPHPFFHPFPYTYQPILFNILHPSLSPYFPHIYFSPSLPAPLPTPSSHPSHPFQPINQPTFTLQLLAHVAPVPPPSTNHPSPPIPSLLPGKHSSLHTLPLHPPILPTPIIPPIPSHTHLAPSPRRAACPG